MVFEEIITAFRLSDPIPFPRYIAIYSLQSDWMMEAELAEWSLSGRIRTPLIGDFLSWFISKSESLLPTSTLIKYCPERDVWDTWIKKKAAVIIFSMQSSEKDIMNQEA